MAVHYLWVQERVESKELVVLKIDGDKNMADVCIRYLTQAAMDRHIRRLPLEFDRGHAPLQCAAEKRS